MMHGEEVGNLRVYVIIPAFNEADAIPKVIRDIPTEWVQEIIVVNNASTDDTVARATEAGATVLTELTRGYGNACLKGIAYLQSLPADQKPDIVVFLDGDYSDYPEEMPTLIQPILTEGYDMVIGSRALGKRAKGSMLPQQIFGNWLATRLIRTLYNVRFTDLGPFRAIRYQSLMDLDMQDKTYGWTVEMQVKAAKQGLRCTEVPVRYRPRIGVSKVTGTVKGTIMAGYKILWTIFKLL
ncbi:MAG: glycosyltransferase family 2 protein [Bacteroidia bacterium]|nr:glycosyltransferase family 2 protein [Bacteroidia bacterium]